MEVVTTAGTFDVDDLDVGTWFWNSGGGWNWIPEGVTPCTGYEIGPDGNPRQVR